jgi:uncharacterized protein (DUF1501 family)
LHISSLLLPQALTGGSYFVPTLVNLEQFHRRLGVPESAGALEQQNRLDALAAQPHARPGSLLQFVERSTLLTYTSSARLERVVDTKAAADGYPQQYDLAKRLHLIAQLIKAGLSTSIYYTQLGGFDTHSNQFAMHAQLLRHVGDSLQAFLDDLKKSGDGQRVVAIVFSEFGRRLTENGSLGTDHGTAAPVFLLGEGVKPGLHGPYPNLQELADGDPKHAVDFRQVYANVLDNWLGCPSEKVLGQKFSGIQAV